MSHPVGPLTDDELRAWVLRRLREEAGLTVAAGDVEGAEAVAEAKKLVALADRRLEDQRSTLIAQMQADVATFRRIVRGE